MDSIAVSHTPPAGVMSALMANQRLTVGFKAKGMCMRAYGLYLFTTSFAHVFWYHISGAMPQVFRNMVEGQLRSKTISASVRYSGARSTLELVLEATPYVGLQCAASAVRLADGMTSRLGVSISCSSAQSSTLAREFRRFVAGLATLSGTLDHDAGECTRAGVSCVCMYVCVCMCVCVCVCVCVGCVLCYPY